VRGSSGGRRAPNIVQISNFNEDNYNYRKRMIINIFKEMHVLII
jgi:hypothetical protein